MSGEDVKEFGAEFLDNPVGQNRLLTFTNTGSKKIRNYM